MNESLRDLRRMYEEELTKGPFPTEECAHARIGGVAHGALILYLADIAGLASRGENLRKIAEPERSKFRKMASRSLYEVCPKLERMISPERTPKLHALVEATENARLVILQELSSERV